MEYLGADQTKSAGLFIRSLYPTDCDRLTSRMADIIKGYKMPDKQNWRILGFDISFGPLARFIDQVINLERAWRETLTSVNMSKFMNELRGRGLYKDETVDDLVQMTRAWVQAGTEGYVTIAIGQPWDYVPSTVATDLGVALGQTVGAAGAGAGVNIPLLVLGAIAVYAGVTVFLPSLIASMTTRKASQ